MEQLEIIIMWVLLGFKKKLPSKNRDMLLFLFHHGKCIHMLPIVDEEKWGTQVSLKEVIARISDWCY